MLLLHEEDRSCLDSQASLVHALEHVPLDQALLCVCYGEKLVFSCNGCWVFKDEIAGRLHILTCVLVLLMIRSCMPARSFPPS